MVTVLKIFFRAPGANAWLVLGCLILASLSEGIGLASLLPLIATMTDTVASEGSAFQRQILGIMEVLGLPRDFEALLALVVGFTLLKSVLLLFAMRYVGYALAQVATKLRLRIVHNILGVRWSYFVSQPVGRITNAMGTEVAGAARAYRTAADFLAFSFQTLVYLTIALLTSWPLTLISLAAGTAIVGCLHFLVGMSRRAGEKRTRHMRRTIAHLNDLLVSIKPLKAMARQDGSKRYMETTLRRLKKAMRKSITSTVYLARFQEMLTVAVLGGGLYIAVRVMETELAELLVLIFVISRLVRNLTRMQKLYQAAAVVEAPYRSVYRLIEETRLAEERLHGGIAPVFEQGCALRGVSFAYGERLVLDGVEIEVPSRGVTVIMGVSGAGKTTLTDLLLGFFEPSAGAVLVDGVPLDRIDLRAWRRMIGYVPQELQLLNASVLTNVTLGDPSIEEEDVRRALAAAGALAFVERLPDGLDSVVGERGGRLSGGQRQRIALARALVTGPRLLILDEVSSALDPETEREICNTLKELSRSTAILAITHQRQFLDIADRAYRITSGTAKQISLDDKISA